MTKVFGLHSLSKAEQINASEEEITSEIAKIKCENKSFKVFVKRADKNFPISSMDLQSLLKRAARLPSSL